MVKNECEMCRSFAHADSHLARLRHRYIQRHTLCRSMYRCHMRHTHELGWNCMEPAKRHGKKSNAILRLWICFILAFVVFLVLFNELTIQQHGLVSASSGSPSSLVELLVQQSQQRRKKSEQPTYLAGSENATAALDILPDWMTSYIHWHQQTKSSLTLSNHKQQKYLILTCRQQDRTCGGLSDRLKPLPLLLLLSAASDRLFLIHWERPAPLEAFLRPSIVDWSVPKWFSQDYSYSSKPFNSLQKIMSALSKRNDQTVVQVRAQDQHGGSNWYNALEQDRLLTGREAYRLPLPQVNVDAKIHHRHFRRVFRSLWSALFTPSIDLRKRIHERFRRNQLLQPYSEISKNVWPVINYVGLHIRSQYGPVPENTKLKAIVINALHCASATRVNDTTQPVVLVADTEKVWKIAHDYAVTSTLPIQVPNNNMGNDTASIPIHLEQHTTNTTNSSSLVALMDVFVDLYVLANGQCTTYGRGGFGRLGSLLSRNSSCIERDFFHAHYKECV